MIDYTVGRLIELQHHFKCISSCFGQCFGQKEYAEVVTLDIFHYFQKKKIIVY